MCFVFIWEQTATCATYSINWLVFITEMKSVYCAVRTWSLTKAVCTSSLKGLSLSHFILRILIIDSLTTADVRPMTRILNWKLSIVWGKLTPTTFRKSQQQKIFHSNGPSKIGFLILFHHTLLTLSMLRTIGSVWSNILINFTDILKENSFSFRSVNTYAPYLYRQPDECPLYLQYLTCYIGAFNNVSE